MNNISSHYRNVFVIAFWIIVVALSAHFLHDLQPGHFDLPGVSAQACTLAIHTGFLTSQLPGITLVDFRVTGDRLAELVDLSNLHSVPLPPPIQA